MGRGGWRLRGKLRCVRRQLRGGGTAVLSHSGRPDNSRLPAYAPAASRWIDSADRNERGPIPALVMSSAWLLVRLDFLRGGLLQGRRRNGWGGRLRLRRLLPCGGLLSCRRLLSGGGLRLRHY